jgi:hypothetical protein
MPTELDRRVEENAPTSETGASKEKNKNSVDGRYHNGDGARVRGVQAMTFGATPKEWQHFDLALGLTADLLPVVSNPDAVIAPDSTLKELGKTPSRYNGSRHVAGIAKWTSQQSTSEQVARWAAEPDYGICLQTRHVRALDVDVTDELSAALIASFLDNLHPGLPRRIRSNSSKFLVAFRLEGEYTKRKFKTTNGIVEFLATGQQFVALGQHPSGSRYEWFDGLPDEFPTLSGAQFESLWSALVEQFATEEASEAPTSVKSQKLAEVHTGDPVATYLLERNLVRKVERDGRLHITCPWESDHTTDSSDSATTYWPAHTGGYVNGHFLCMHAHCEHRTDAEFKEAIGYVDEDALNDFAVLNPENTSADKARNRFAFAPAHEFVESAAPSWLIKGVLPRAGLGVVYGPSGSGKTFQVLDMAFAIARGGEWRGHKVTQGRVAYIAAEGAGGVRTRLKAYSIHHGIPLNEVPFHLLGAAPNFIEKADAMDIAKAVLAAGGADLLIVDTLAQVMPGGDENSGKDMGALLNHCRGIHVATNAMVLLVHHPGKNEDRGARGWSGLRGALDVELRVESEAGTVSARRLMTITKMKDAEEGLEFGFSLRSVAVGLDDDGEAITSCVVEHNDAIPKTQRKKAPTGKVESLVMRQFAELNSLCGDGVRDVELLEAVVEQLPTEGKSSASQIRAKALRAMEAVVCKGLLRKGENGRYVE